MDYEQGLAMARAMKASNDEITDAMLQVQEAQHGVVALRFTDHGQTMQIMILDEPFDPNVRIYPGE